VNAGSGALASYTYDGFGERVIKTVSGSYGEIYQYGQDGMLLEETDASGVAQADYIYLNGRPMAVLNGSTLYFLHDDMLGTPQVASDSSQNIAWQAGYAPFGQTSSVSGTITQNLRFPGQYFDVESGWNHNGFRDYMPELGRYVEPDPLGRLGSGNDLYAYVGNNPTDLIDPLGLCAAMNHAPNKPCNSSSIGNRVATGLEGVANLADDALRARALVAGVAALSEAPPAAATFAVYGVVSIFGQGFAGVSQITESVTGNMSSTAHQAEQLGNVLAAPASGLTTLVITKGNLSEAEKASAYEGLVNGGVGLVDRTVPLLQRLTEFGMGAEPFLPDCSQ
jgi:RHS repeat-associated protein